MLNIEVVKFAVLDPDLEIRRGGARLSRPLDKEGGAVSQKNFSALGASVWSKHKGGQAPRAPRLDPPLICLWQGVLFGMWKRGRGPPEERVTSLACKKDFLSSRRRRQSLFLFY